MNMTSKATISKSSKSKLLALAGIFLAVLFAVLVGGIGNIGSNLVGPALALLTILGPALVFGAVTVTYTYPVAGTTAPVAGTEAKDYVCADIIATADADTTAVVTHNLGLSAADLTAVQVTATQTLSQALTALSAWAQSAIAANSVTFTKLTSTGSGNAAAQLRVTVRRPHSIGK